MSDTLFKRTGKLLLGERQIAFGGGDQLRVTFSVSKQLLSVDPNVATIKVWNLSAETRANLNQVYLARTGRIPVLLEAGYADEHGTIFKGETTQVSNAREPTGWVTTINAASGRSMARKRINRAYAANADLQQILTDMVNDTVKGAVGAGKEALEAIRSGKVAAAGKALVKGVLLAGDPQRVFDELAKSGDFDFFIDDEELVLVPAGGARSAPAVVLRYDTGLVGVPERILDESRPGRLVVKTSSLLSARFSIGSRLRLESETLSGDFRAEKVDHAGDTHGDDWTTTTEAVEVT